MNNSNIFYLKKELSKIQGLFIKKEFSLVIKKSKILLRKNPEQPIIYNLIGLSHLELNEPEKALKIFLLAIEKISSNDPSIFCNIGNTYKKFGDLRRSKEYYNKSLTLNSEHVPSLINLGHLANTLRQSERATKYYSDAYRVNNNSEEVLIYSILNYSSNGNFSEAKKIITELNNKFPNNTKSYQLFSKIHKYKIEDPHQKIMLDKIKDQNLNYEDLSNLYFALAKSFFDQKNIEKFVYYTDKANKTKFKTFGNYNLQLEENKFKQITKHFQNFQFQDYSNNKGENLIFILGLPRSGTTLLHQIISAHSNAFGAEESFFLSGFLDEKFKDENSFTQFFSKELMNKDLVSKLSDDILSNYKLYDEKKIIVDKMPFNFKWIGFIKILFPKAKIIHSNRNIIDSTFSIYRNLFDAPEMGWAYNQDYLVKYVNLYNDLMSFWQGKIGNSIYEYYYEELVANQVDETRKILKFCNLEFEDGCINYTKNKIAVSTVSISQAREKIYKSSVNLSEKYLNYFPFLNGIKKRPLKKGPFKIK